MQGLFDSFWGHIDDLRQTFLRSVIVVGIGFIAALSFYQPILQLFTSTPMEQGHSGLLKQRIERSQILNRTSREQFVEIPSNSRLISDLPGELNKHGHFHYRLAAGEALIYEQAVRSPLLIMGPIEGLILVFRACFWLSLAGTAPIWGWIWLQFILPGIQAHERAILIPFLFGSLICLFLGGAMAYFVTLPIANQYLTLFNSGIGQNAWTLTNYVNYVLFLCLGHAIAAELALLLMILVHFRILSPEWLISKRRYLIVAAFILGALLTPPDVLTQLLLALPLMGIYEIAIWYAKFRVPERDESFREL